MKKLERAPYTKIISSASFHNVIISKEGNALLKKINEEYLYWDKVKYLPMPEGVTAAEIWALVKLRRENTSYELSFGKYKFYWNINSRIQEMLHFLDMNIGGSLESSSIISKGDKNRYLISSIMEEAIASSQIEGAVTTRRQAKDMLRKNKKPKNKSEQMIMNNFITIQQILSIKDSSLSKETLLNIHKLVTSETLTNHNEEGIFRMDDEINVIDTIDGSIVHHPPSYMELDELMNDLSKFFNEENDAIFIHPIIRACILHFMVGFIHPFVDGNGRTARALFYWYLLRKNYWLTEYLSISRLILVSKTQYAKAFQYTEVDNDLTYFISYNLRAMKLAFEGLREYIKRKNDEKKHLSSFLGLDGINYRQALILEWFYKEPELLLTIKEVETRLVVSNQTARVDLNDLVDKGYLEITKLNKVMKAYTKSTRFDSLSVKREKQNRQSQAENQQSLF